MATQPTDIIFLVEGTAVNGGYLPELKQHYILPILEQFSGHIDEKDCGSDSNYCLFGLVVFHASDILPGDLIDIVGPTTTSYKLLSDLDRIQFAGGHGEAAAHVGEGFAAALQCLEDLGKFRNCASDAPETIKHIILICNCKPYGLPVVEHTGTNGCYKGQTADQLAGLMLERKVHLTILAPRKLPALNALYERAGGDLTSQKGYARDPRHLILLSGFQLPVQERPATPSQPKLPELLIPQTTTPASIQSTQTVTSNQMTTAVSHPTTQLPTAVPVSVATPQKMPNSVPLQSGQFPNIPVPTTTHQAPTTLVQSLQQTTPTAIPPPPTTQSAQHGQLTPQQVMQMQQMQQGPMAFRNPRSIQQTRAMLAQQQNQQQMAGQMQQQMNKQLSQQQLNQMHQMQQGQLQQLGQGHQVPPQLVAQPQLNPQLGQQQLNPQVSQQQLNPQLGQQQQLTPQLGQQQLNPQLGQQQLNQQMGQQQQQNPQLNQQLNQQLSQQQLNQQLAQQQQLNQQQINQQQLINQQLQNQQHQQLLQQQQQQRWPGQLNQQQLQGMQQPRMPVPVSTQQTQAQVNANAPQIQRAPQEIINRLNQPPIAQSQSPPGPMIMQSQQPNIQKERRNIWQGLLEWHEKLKGPPEGQKVPRQVPCQVSANVVNNEPEVKGDGWPTKLIMQLIPKQIVGNLGGSYFMDVKTVLFMLQQCDALTSLTRVMESGFAGCVHFTGGGNCSIKVLILLYSKERCAYLGFIPNDQLGFVDRIRKVIQQQKTQQATMRQGQGGAGFPQQPGGNAPPRMIGLPGQQQLLSQQLQAGQQMQPGQIPIGQQQATQLQQMQPVLPQQSQNVPQQSSEIDPRELERQRNVMEIQQLQAQLQAAKQRELEFQQQQLQQGQGQPQQGQMPVQLGQMAGQQIMPGQQQMPGPQQGSLPNQQQMLSGMQQRQFSPQQRGMRPSNVQQTNPGLKSLLQQQSAVAAPFRMSGPMSRMQGMQPQQQGLPSQDQTQQMTPQQYEDVRILDLLK